MSADVEVVEGGVEVVDEVCRDSVYPIRSQRASVEIGYLVVLLVVREVVPLMMCSRVSRTTAVIASVS